jgi:hypothetical protein
MLLATLRSSPTFQFSYSSQIWRGGFLDGAPRIKTLERDATAAGYKATNSGGRTNGTLILRSAAPNKLHHDLTKGIHQQNSCFSASGRWPQTAPDGALFNGALLLKATDLAVFHVWTVGRRETVLAWIGADDGSWSGWNGMVDEHGAARYGKRGCGRNRTYTGSLCSG